MTEQILNIEEHTHHCILPDTDGIQNLRHIIYQVTSLIDMAVDEDSNAILHDIKAQLNEAESHLNTIRPLGNLNAWKHNLQEFSKAKAGILYSLNLLQAALRFGKLTCLQNNFPQAIEQVN